MAYYDGRDGRFRGRYDKSGEGGRDRARPGQWHHLVLVIRLTSPWRPVVGRGEPRRSPARHWLRGDGDNQTRPSLHKFGFLNGGSSLGGGTTAMEDCAEVSECIVYLLQRLVFDLFFSFFFGGPHACAYAFPWTDGFSPPARGERLHAAAACRRASRRRRPDDMRPTACADVERGQGPRAAERRVPALNAGSAGTRFGRTHAGAHARVGKRLASVVRRPS